MKKIKVIGKFTRTGNYVIRSASELEEGNLDIDTPSMLVNLVSLREKLRRKFDGGFSYTFPFTINEKLETNYFTSTFPLIFE